MSDWGWLVPAGLVLVLLGYLGYAWAQSCRRQRKERQRAKQSLMAAVLHNYRRGPS